MEIMKLLSPENLYLLIPVGILIIAGFTVHFILRKRFELFLKRSWAKLFSQLRSSVASVFKLSLGGLTLICLILTLCRPVIIRPNYHQNFLVLMDLSRSMAVEDYVVDGKQVSRLEMVQLALKNLVEELPPEARLGVATFVGYGYLPGNINLIRTYPQTVGSSRKELKQLIDWIHWDQASSSGTPIQRAIAEISSYIEEHSKVLGDNLTIILITDGEENIPPFPSGGNYLSPHRQKEKKENLLKLCSASQDEKTNKDFKFKFLIVGVGTSSGGPIPKFDENWNFVGYEQDYYSGQTQISRRNDVLLMELTQKLGADYLRIDKADDLKILANDPKYKTAISASQKDISIYPILAALAFFLFALVL